METFSDQYLFIYDNLKKIVPGDKNKKFRKVVQLLRTYLKRHFFRQGTNFDLRNFNEKKKSLKFYTNNIYVSKVLQSAKENSQLFFSLFSAHIILLLLLILKEIPYPNVS